MAAVTLRIVCDAPELESLWEPWERLWFQDQDAVPFQHPAWLVPWWHNFSQPQLRVITLWQDRQLIGLVPLYVYAEPQGGARKLLLLGAGTSDYLDGVFSPHCRPEHVLHALAHLAKEDDWSVADFAQLRPCSALFRAVHSLETNQLATSFAGESCSRCAALPIAQLPRKLRADVRYYTNYARALGQLQLELADELTWERAFEFLVSFHTARWQQAGEAGVLTDPAVLAWHRAAIPLLLESGLLRLLTLTSNREPLAVLYSLIDPPRRGQRTQYFYLSGYSLQHGKLQPGTLLSAMATHEASNEQAAGTPGDRLSLRCAHHNH